MTFYIVARTVDLFFEVVTWAILIYCIMTWFPTARGSRFFGFLSTFVDPITRPFRGISRWIIQKTGIGLDFSVWMALIALRLVERVVWNLLYLFF